MTDAQAKRLGVTSARRRFLREEVPSLGQAINMLAGEEPSPSWQDIVDVDTMFIQGDILHVSASITLPLAVENLNISVVI